MHSSVRAVREEVGEGNLGRCGIGCGSHKLMWRRAEIAAAWIRAPRCLLADEPFRGINPSDVEVLAEAFRGMAREGCAVVITGHEVRQLLDMADDIVWMTAGTTHGMGAPQEASRACGVAVMM